MKYHYSVVPNWLKFIKVERDLTQLEMAVMLQIDVRTYRKYEDNPGEMPLSNVLLVANVFNIDINKIIFDKAAEIRRSNQTWEETKTKS